MPKNGKKTKLKKITLRPYQKECVDIVNALPDGSRSIVALATGLGKTVTAAHFKTKGKILWISHRDELVRQPEKYFKAIGKTYGIEKAQETSHGEDVVSASIQSISTDSRLKRFSPDEFDLIICDEAHHAAAATYKKTLSYFKPRKLIGLTATPKRGDGKRLTDSFDSICFQRNLLWGIEEGYLSPIRCLRASASFDMKRIKLAMGDFTASSLENEMDTSDDDLVVAKMYLQHCLKQGRQTLIYCPTVAISNKVCQTIKEAVGKDKENTIAIIDAKTPVETRHQIEQDFNDKKINCICNCMVLTEGADFPSVECIINNRPTANATLYEQMIGRGTRLYEGKKYCLVIDIVGKNSNEKSICTAPTLFGIDPDALPKETRERLYKDEDLHEVMKNITIYSKEKMDSLIIHQEIIDIFTQKRLAILEDNKSKGFKDIARAYNDELTKDITEYDFKDIVVKHTPTDEHYYEIPATYTGFIWLSKPDMLDKTVMEVSIPEIKTGIREGLDFVSEPLPMEEAISMAEDILKYAVPSSYKIKWSKTERERMSHDKASEKQQNYIRVLYKNKAIRDDIESLNKLEASDLIELSKELEAFDKEKQEVLDNIRQLKGKGKSSNTREKLKALEEKDKKAKEQKVAYKKHRNARYFTFKESFSDLIAKKKKEENSITEYIGKEMYFELKTEGNSTYKMRYAATQNQVVYARALMEKLEKRYDRIFNYKEDVERYSSWRISMTIQYLKELQRIPVGQGCILRVNSQKFFNDLDRIERTAQMPESIICVFVIIKDE